MASLKELRNRISSVKATKKITRAMQMVAAAKLRRAQMAAESGRAYAVGMKNMMANLASRAKGQSNAHPLLVGRAEEKVVLLVVCTAERGLCGGFNALISKAARLEAAKLKTEGKTVKLLTVGKKGHELLRGDFGNDIIEHITFRELRSVGIDQAKMVAGKVLELFETGEVDGARLFFSRFKSVLQQIPTQISLIPAEVPEDQVGQDSSYEYEPEESDLLAELLPQNLVSLLMSALLENAASEQGARMSAMDSATRNAGEMIDKLTLNYNKSRQAMITKELIEIISGAEAL